MIKIYFTKLKAQLQENFFKKYLAQISLREQDRNNRFLKWQDKHLHLFGKLLLKDSLIQLGYQPKDIHFLTYSKNEKPEFSNIEFEFNISHSGNYAVCAVSEKIKLGVDIEEIREIHLSDFKNVFTPNELKLIHTAPKPINKFFEFWTRKESIIKADGRGLSIPLNEFEVIDNLIEYDNNRWFIKNLGISNFYASNIAVSKNDVQICYEEINYYT